MRVAALRLLLGVTRRISIVPDTDIEPILTPPHNSGKCENVSEDKKGRCDHGHHHGNNVWPSGPCLLHGYN